MALATEVYPGFTAYVERAAPRRIAVFRLRAMSSHAPHHEPKSLNALAFSATVHCLTGCAIGEVLGMIIGTALGWSDFATIALSVVLAFFFGYLLTSLPLLRSGMALSAVIPLALASDTISITIMEIVDNAIMLLIPGAMEATLTDIGFWAALAVALADRRHGRLPGQPLAARARQGPRRGARAPRALNRRARAKVEGVGHHHGHSHGVSADADSRKLAIALALILGFMCVEVAVGIAADSLALLSDAAHMLTDAGALALSLVAIRLARRPAAGAMTYGLKRTRDPRRGDQRVDAARARPADRLRGRAPADRPARGRGRARARRRRPRHRGEPRRHARPRAREPPSR